MSQEGLLPRMEVNELHVRIKVSYKWITKKWNCTLYNILHPKGCGGCCKAHNRENYWPPASTKTPDGKKYKTTDPERPCMYLGENGCTLPLKDKPIGCMLTPLSINANNTMIVMHRMQLKHSICKCKADIPDKDKWHACGRGPMLIDAMKDSLIHLFGEPHYNRVRHDVVDLKRDSYFDMTNMQYAQLMREWDWEKKMQFPKPRTTPIRGLKPEKLQSL